jgi:hypothetical protein
MLTGDLVLMRAFVVEPSTLTSLVKMGPTGKGPALIGQQLARGPPQLGLLRIQGQTLCPP